MSSNSSQNIVLLLECKGGKNIEKKQLETYLQVSPDDVNGLVTVNNPNKLNVSFAYTTHDVISLKKSISETLSEIKKEGLIQNVPSNLDLLELTDTIAKVHSIGNFSWERNLIQGISVSPWTFPMNFYPFSDDDNPEYILVQVISSIIHLISKKKPLNPNEIVLTPDEVMQDLYEAVNAYIPTSKKRGLRKLVDDCFRALLRERKIRNKIYRLGMRGTKLSFKLNEGIIEDLKDLVKAIEEGQEQTELTEFF